MKVKICKIITAILVLTLILSLMLCGGITAHAEDGIDTYVADEGEESTEAMDDGATDADAEGALSPTPDENGSENGQTGGEISDASPNIFEEIYTALQLNADKIFSILAFIGTLIVGVGYKSGLLPLLRDAITKLKGSIDKVKDDEAARGVLTEENLQRINSSIEDMRKDLSEIKDQSAEVTELCYERESMRLILEAQIDMLYAIFMSSALPQYQKDEVGERISEMREELKLYESGEEK